MTDAYKSANFKSWKKLLTTTDSGSYRTNEYNVIAALENADELKGALLYNSFGDQITVTRRLPWHAVVEGEAWSAPQWQDRDRIELQVWLQANGILVSHSNVVQDSVIAVAYRHDYHPVRAYLRALAGTWDGKPRIRRWLLDYCHARDDQRYLEQIGPKFLLGAVARAMNTDVLGVQMDTMLVLEGSTGLGKSSLVRVLSRGWCTDVANQLHDKEAAILIQGVWFGELGELSAIARSMLEASKLFISRVCDKYRPPYGRNAIDRPRQCVFVATTEEQEYLQDLRSNRRFWPVDCGQIDLTGLARDREQIWAEAYYHWQQGSPHHLDDEGQALAYREQYYRRRVDTLETAVLVYMDSLRAAGIPRVDMHQILVDCLHYEREAIGRDAGPTAKRVSAVLTANGWIKERARGRGRTRVQFYVYDAARDPSVVLDRLNEKTPEVRDASLTS